MGARRRDRKEKVITDRVITMEWLNSNPAAQLIEGERASGYHTYRMLDKKAYGYKEITVKNLYPGIDLVYHFTEQSKAGFEYSLRVQPGADISNVQLKYVGDKKSITTDKKGTCLSNHPLRE
ncbi:MAG: hypothetical protein IPP73_05235 [Chitinophagaceae bacterium]|nr:hypothetical protein [Chitinophagaceae bacterium]